MKAILRSGFLALAIMALAVPVHAGPLEDGNVAYERKDYATALKYWRPLAKRGDATAQYNLGHMYRLGQPWQHLPQWVRAALSHKTRGLVARIAPRGKADKARIGDVLGRFARPWEMAE